MKIKPSRGKRPLLVTLAALVLIVTGIMVILGAVAGVAFGSAIVGDSLNRFRDSTGLAVWAIAISLAVLGAMHVVVGLRVSVGAGWSWMSGLTLAGLGLVGASASLSYVPFTGAIGLLVNGLVLYGLIAERRWFRPSRL